MKISLTYPLHNFHSFRHPAHDAGYSSTWGTYSPNATFPADETTDYTYDRENRLTKAVLPSTDEVEFTYDGMGRRLTKTVTETVGTDTVVTTYKYHYLGGQITTIEIDQDTTDNATPPVTTPTKDETIHIHLGPNSQPISFEWERYDYPTSTTLSDTYYYHYDIHGNVIKVTDSSATPITKIFYEYDVLGEIVSSSNPDGIPNLFAFRGLSQTLHDEEIGMNFGGGFYKSDTGTLFGGNGTAAFQNPTSGTGISAMSQNTLGKSQSNGGIKVCDMESDRFGPGGFMLGGGSNSPEGLSGGDLISDNQGLAYTPKKWLVDVYASFDEHIRDVVGVGEIVGIGYDRSAFKEEAAEAYCRSLYAKRTLYDSGQYRNFLSLQLETFFDPELSAKDFMKNTFDSSGAYSIWMNGLVMSHGNVVNGTMYFDMVDGSRITVTQYFEDITETAFDLADEIMIGIGMGEYGLGVHFRSRFPTYGALAAFIYNMICDYDESKGPGAHKSNLAAFERWLVQRMKEMGLLSDMNGTSGLEHLIVDPGMLREPLPGDGGSLDTGGGEDDNKDGFGFEFWPIFRKHMNKSNPNTRRRKKPGSVVVVRWDAFRPKGVPETGGEYNPIRNPRYDPMPVKRDIR